MRCWDIRLSVAVLIVIALAVLGSGCTGGKAQPAQSEPPSGKGVVKEFNVTAVQYEFLPGEIVVNKDDRVILHIKSADVTHGFAILDYDISEMLNPGEEVTVDFVADKAGEFTFFCSVPCGTGHSGMQGKLIVNS